MRSKLPKIGTSIFSVMSKMANEHKAINLSQGFPGFDIAPDLIDLVQHYMKQGQNQYAPMPGVPVLRENIAKKINTSYDCNCSPEQNITVTAGATQAIYTGITALVEEGDEVIYFEPAYDSYKPSIMLNGGVPVNIQLVAPDFSIPWDEVQRLISDRTKLIIINTPHNPTGTVLSESDLDQLADIIDNRDIHVLSDEVYEHIIFDDIRHQSVLAHDKLRDRSMAVFSFGKTFHATGWKMGYVVAPQSITEEIRRIHQFMVFSVNTAVQYALAEYLNVPEHYTSLCSFYQDKRDAFLDLMKDSQFRPIKCSGTYFQSFSYEAISSESDFSMAQRITKEYGVASIPISAFYAEGHDDHLLRFCFAKNTEELQKAAEILCKI